MYDVETYFHAKITFSQFMSAARNKYLNMVAPKEYNKVDLQKQELLALTTKIEGLEAQLRQNTALATSGGDGGGTNAAAGLDRSEVAALLLSVGASPNKARRLPLMARRTGGARSMSTPLAAGMECTSRTSPRITTQW